MDSPDKLEKRVGERMIASRLTLAIAESCTGGLVSSRITDVNRASSYFLGCVVAYSNAVKMSVLGVSEESLMAHGAVSEPVARQMAEGVRARLGSNMGVGITGIAGPGGGTPEKPVGLVYIAVADDRGCEVTRNEFGGVRAEVKAQAADKALMMVLERIT